MDIDFQWSRGVVLDVPVLCMPGVYFSVDKQIGAWGEWKNLRASRKGK